MLGVWLLLTANPFATSVSSPETLGAAEPLGRLLWWHVLGLGGSEFVPMAILPILALPLFVERLEGLRSAAQVGVWLVGPIFLACLVTVAVTPLPREAMRYLFPVIAAGSIASAIALTILWSVPRPLAVVATLAIVFTNIPHLSFTGSMPTRTVSCTLCEYVLENANDYETATEVLIRRLGNLPNNTSVLIQPAFMAYSPMFYLPDLVFCCQLTGKKAINREVPDYLFSESADPDVGVVLVSREH